MNFSKKNHNLVGQNEETVKKSQKHDANLQKNSTLYFQVGLILTLLATYGLFEMEFQTKAPYVITIETGEEDLVVMNDFTIYEEEVKKIEKQIKKPVIFKDPIIKDDVPEVVETPDVFTEPVSTSGPVINPDKFIEPEKPKEPVGPVSILGVEQVPIYPGCDGLSSNKERLECMSKKLNKLVGRKFNSDIVSDLGLSKDQRIYVNFKIDKTGNITEIKARSPHIKLKKEAIKVANKIPQMTPAKQSDKNVEVMYTLPIMIKVNNN